MDSRFRQKPSVKVRCGSKIERCIVRSHGNSYVLVIETIRFYALASVGKSRCYSYDSSLQLYVILSRSGVYHLRDYHCGDQALNQNNSFYLWFSVASRSISNRWKCSVSRQTWTLGLSLWPLSAFFLWSTRPSCFDYSNRAVTIPAKIVWISYPTAIIRRIENLHRCWPWTCKE